MNEWLKRVLEQIKTLWGKWTSTQKLILFAVIGAALLGIILLVVFSSAPSMVPLITTPVTDVNLRDRISVRLDQDGVPHTISPSGVIMVRDEQTARRERAVLAALVRQERERNPENVHVFRLEKFDLLARDRVRHLLRFITCAP